MAIAAVVDELSTRHRLKRAVHRYKVASAKGLQERLFTLMFSGLVYPQIWEDPEVDLAAMKLDPNCHIVTIASGGCNVMSYLAAGPARISAVDLNRAHVALTRLKLAGAAHLPGYDAFFRFFGRADLRDNLALYRTYLRPHLDEASRGYWDGRGISGRRRISLFRKNVFHFGLLGRFIGAAHLCAKVYGVDVERLVEAGSLDEQRAFFEAHMAPVFDRKLVRWLVDHPAALFGLGIPPSQFQALSGGRKMHHVLRERLERLACDFAVQDNYFAWQAFARRYSPHHNGPVPMYLRREYFPVLRQAHDRVTVSNCSVTDFLGAQPAMSADRYVLLDAQDWMTDGQLNALWREITRTARPNARVIFRTADVPSLLPGRLDDQILSRWRYHDAESVEFTRKDRSSIYGGFHLYSLKAE